MKTTAMLALGLALLGTSTAALATTKKHTATAPTHHCQLQGTEVPKSKKACIKAGGTWEKGAPSAKPAAAPAMK
jgi:hypothetical protein